MYLFCAAVVDFRSHTKHKGLGHIIQLFFTSTLRITFHPFSATRLYKRPQNKVKVKGLGKESFIFSGSFNFSSWCYEKIQSVVAKKTKTT